MGICQTRERARDTEKSCQIDKQLEKDKAKQEYKILLLGNIKYKVFRLLKSKKCSLLFFR